jgi:hypothetical protein
LSGTRFILLLLLLLLSTATATHFDRSGRRSCSLLENNETKSYICRRPRNGHWNVIVIIWLTLLKMGIFFFSLSLSLSYMTPSKISNRNDEFLIDVEFLIEIKRHNCALKHILEKKTIRLSGRFNS